MELNPWRGDMFRMCSGNTEEEEAALSLQRSCSVCPHSCPGLSGGKLRLVSQTKISSAEPGNENPHPLWRALTGSANSVLGPISCAQVRRLRGAISQGGSDVPRASSGGVAEQDIIPCLAGSLRGGLNNEAGVNVELKGGSNPGTSVSSTRVSVSSTCMSVSSTCMAVAHTCPSAAHVWQQHTHLFTRRACCSFLWFLEHLKRAFPFRAGTESPSAHAL